VDSSMIIAEFIAELRSVQDLFEWKLLPNPEWREERRSRPRLRIRAVLGSSGNELQFDPIDAVCFAKTGRIYDAESWMEAANDIGLNLIAAADITATTNERTWKAGEDGRILDPYLVSLRTSLLNTVRLHESESVTFSL